VPMQEEWGTLDTLRHISDKLTGSDILIVSGDVITKENLRKLSDLHRAKRSGLTLLLNKPTYNLKTAVIPGSKTNKYKSERDLVGLSGDTVCLFKAEADVEDEINISARILRRNPRFTVHTNLQDSHIYLMKRWMVEEVLSDKTLTTVKGELIPKLVSAQFKAAKCGDQAQDISGEPTEARKFTCFAAITEEPTVRVNNIPSFWEGCRLLMEGTLPLECDLPPVSDSAKVHEKSQMKECLVGSKSVVSEKTSLTGVTIGANCTINEKVILNNCIIMDGVTIASRVNIKDSIICEGSTVEAGCELNQCIVGKQCKVAADTSVSSQVLLNSDRMMHV